MKAKTLPNRRRSKAISGGDFEAIPEETIREPGLTKRIAIAGQRNSTTYCPRLSAVDFETFETAEMRVISFRYKTTEAMTAPELVSLLHEIQDAYRAL